MPSNLVNKIWEGRICEQGRTSFISDSCLLGQKYHPQRVCHTGWNDMEAEWLFCVCLLHWDHTEADMIAPCVLLLCFLASVLLTYLSKQE
jgi:hypothetical protein